MARKLHIVFFGSSLVSAYWNGAATYYRGLLKALSRRGHRITFFEPDAYERQQHRDIPDPDWARVVVYEATHAALKRALRESSDADVVIKASGVGVLDRELEEDVLTLARAGTRVGFCDVDAPATLERLARDRSDPFRALVPEYDFVFTYGGGPPVLGAYMALGARRCRAIYNAVDPETHHPVAPRASYRAALGFMGNRLPDREARVEALFINAARQSSARFLLAGSGWLDKPLPDNVTYLGHLSTREHNAFNCSPLALLNVSRNSMAETGFSPATRVFEAAAAGACLITDAWPGLPYFFEPGEEILTARSGAEVAELLRHLEPADARRIGQRARERALAEHTYAARAVDLEELLLEAHAGSTASATRQEAAPTPAAAVQS